MLYSVSFTEALIRIFQSIWELIWGSIHIYTDENRTLSPYDIWDSSKAIKTLCSHKSVYITFDSTRRHTLCLEKVVLASIERVADVSTSSNNREAGFGDTKISTTGQVFTFDRLTLQFAIHSISMYGAPLNKRSTKLRAKQKINWRHG